MKTTSNLKAMDVNLKTGYVSSYSIGQSTYRFNRNLATIERIEGNKVYGRYNSLSEAIADKNRLPVDLEPVKLQPEPARNKREQVLHDMVTYELNKLQPAICNLRNLIQSIYHFKLYNYGNR